jgi:hypothetical protein
MVVQAAGLATPRDDVSPSPALFRMSLRRPVEASHQSERGRADRLPDVHWHHSIAGESGAQPSVTFTDDTKMLRRLRVAVLIAASVMLAATFAPFAHQAAIAAAAVVVMVRRAGTD